MGMILTILDFVVVLLVLTNVSLSIWKGPSGNAHSVILSVCVTAAVLIFGLVSLMAAYGLTAGSGFNQGALLIFLVAMAGATRLSRKKRAVQ